MKLYVCSKFAVYVNFDKGFICIYLYVRTKWLSGWMFRNTVLLIENNFVLIHTNLLLGKALLLSLCIFVGGK